MFLLTVIVLIAKIGISFCDSTTHHQICLSRNGTIQSLLEGIFQDSTYHYDDHGTLEFVSQNEYLNEPLYLWYYDSKWWLSPSAFVDTQFSPSSPWFPSVYGYCPGGVNGLYPVCTGCWLFYWDLPPLNTSNAKYIQDCSFNLKTSDLTECDHGYNGTMDYVNSLCLNRRILNKYSNNDAYDDIEDVPIDLMALIGQYDKLKLDKQTEEWYQHQDKDKYTYIWHNKIYNHWLIGAVNVSDTYFVKYLEMGMDITIHIEPLLLCGDINGIPRECVVWDQTKQTSKRVDNVLSVSDECKTNAKSSNKGKNIGTVIAICSVSMICFGFIVYILLMKCVKRDKGLQSVKTEIVETPRHVAQTYDNDGAVDQEAYDMTALNVDHNDEDSP